LNDRLNDWYENLNDFCEYLHDWQDYLQESADELEYRLYDLNHYHWRIYYTHNDLHYLWDEFYKWQDGLLEISSVLEEWDDLLRLHTNDMLDWHHELYLSDIPDLPDYSKWYYLETPDETSPGVPHNVERVELLELTSWDDAIVMPTYYTGTQIADAFDRNFPLANHVMDLPIDLDRPPHYSGDPAPDEVDYHFMMMAEQPDSPLKPPPPRPDDFWHSLGDMHNQLSSFDVDAFLSYDIHGQVDASLASYDLFLQSLRDYLNFVFEDNIWLMHDVHAQYEHFLHGLRWDAFSAHAAEHYALQNVIYDFAEIMGDNSDNTRSRLDTFANMMPESRLPAGINQDLVDFAVAPFEFISLGLWEEDVAITLADSSVESMVYTYWQFQRMAVFAVGGVFLLTLVISYGAYLFGKRKARTELKAEFDWHTT